MVRLVVAVSAIAIPAVALVACAGSSPPAPTTSPVSSSLPPPSPPPPSADSAKSTDAGVASATPSDASPTVPPTAQPVGWLSVAGNDTQTWKLKMCPKGARSTSGAWADCYRWPGNENRNVTTYFRPGSASGAVDGGADKVCTIVASRQGDAGSPPFAPGEYVLYQPTDADGGAGISPGFISQQIEKGHTVILQTGFTGSVEVADPKPKEHLKGSDHSKAAGTKCAADSVETWLLQDPGAGTYTQPAPGAGDVSLTFEWEKPDASESNGAKYKCKAQ